MNDCQSKYCFNWKITGRIIGWIGAIASVGLVICCGPLILIYSTDVYIFTFIFMCGINLMACISWLIGISKTKLILMMIPLLWWTILLLLWLLYIAYALWIAVRGGHFGDKPYLLRDDPVYGITVFCTVYYVYALIGYKQMKAAIRLATSSKLPQYEASYRVANENGTTDVQCAPTV